MCIYGPYMITYGPCENKIDIYIYIQGARASPPTLLCLTVNWRWDAECLVRDAECLVGATDSRWELFLSAFKHVFCSNWFKLGRKRSPRSAGRLPQTLPRRGFEGPNGLTIAKMCMVIVFISSDIRFWTQLESPKAPKMSPKRTYK